MFVMSRDITVRDFSTLIYLLRERGFAVRWANSIYTTGVAIRFDSFIYVEFRCDISLKGTYGTPELVVRQAKTPEWKHDNQFCIEIRDRLSDGEIAALRSCVVPALGVRENIIWNEGGSVHSPDAVPWLILSASNEDVADIYSSVARYLFHSYEEIREFNGFEEESWTVS